VIVLHQTIHETDLPTQWPSSKLEYPSWYRQAARSSIPAPLADPYRRLHPMPSSWLRVDLPETRSLMVRRIWVKAGGPVDMPSMPAPLAADEKIVGLALQAKGYEMVGLSEVSPGESQQSWRIRGSLSSWRLARRRDAKTLQNKPTLSHPQAKPRLARL
jgi:hypothetical protein